MPVSVGWLPVACRFQQTLSIARQARCSSCQLAPVRSDVSSTNSSWRHGGEIAGCAILPVCPRFFSRLSRVRAISVSEKSSRVRERETAVPQSYGTVRYHIDKVYCRPTFRFGPVSVPPVSQYRTHWSCGADRRQRARRCGTVPLADGLGATRTWTFWQGAGRGGRAGVMGPGVG